MNHCVEVVTSTGRPGSAAEPRDRGGAMRTRVVGAIEAGGTKFQCALMRGADDILATQRIATTTPSATLGAVLDFFVAAQGRFGEAEAFGIGCFGPLDLKTASPGFGHLLPTPKQGWGGADLIGPFIQRFAKPVRIDTDVNAAALAELAAAGPSINSLVYVTVGTGIGGGAVIAGRPLHGLLHPEMGHIAVRRDPRDREFAGVCPFHGDCLEGLASGPAVQARWGRPLDQLDAAHPAAGIIGGYLGQLAATIALTLSAERIVFGGGVMTNGAVLPHVRAGVTAQLNGYLPAEPLSGNLESYITSPILGERSGLLGAALLALQAY